MNTLETVQTLAECLRACNWSNDLGTAKLSEVVVLISATAGKVGLELPGDERRLLKLAALTVAYFRNVRRAVNGDLDLDFREEEILKAVEEHRKERPS